jgi:hypothetical protein
MLIGITSNIYSGSGYNQSNTPGQTVVLLIISYYDFLMYQECQNGLSHFLLCNEADF